MKSRTSSFNLTVFKKDLTRFAPAWAVYLVVLALIMTGILDDRDPYYQVRSVREFIYVMGWINLLYGCVVAQLLFGDLYNSRLCNALHAMPMTRDGWFVTHIASGLTFSLLPNLAVTALGFLLLNLEAGWSSLLWLLLASLLQYLFFFGTAVLCVMLAGNRLGQIALYGILNFVSVLAYGLAEAVYQPLLHGIRINSDSFMLFCPVEQISQNQHLEIRHETLESALGGYVSHIVHGVTPTKGWGYMAICAVLGILALTGALALYRKRRLECAGDFVAFRAIEPVVTVLVTVFGGGTLYLFGDMFGWSMKYALLATGAVVGFFGCRMLMERTTRVFRKKTFLGCGAIIGIFALTLVLSWLDPVGITRYQPDVDEIESVTFSQSYSMDHHGDGAFTAAEAEDISAILGVHRDCIDRSAFNISELHPDAINPLSLRLEYRLNNGKTINRFYEVLPDSRAGQVLKGYVTRFDAVMGFPEAEIPERVQFIRHIYVEGMDYGTTNSGLDPAGLLRAIAADCKAGNMAQFNGFHFPSYYDLKETDEAYDMPIVYLEIAWNQKMQEETGPSDIVSYTSLQIYRSCTNTLNWLEDNGLLNDEFKKEMAIKYGGAYAEFAIPTGN